MPVQTIYSPDTYTGDGTEDTYEFTFRILAKPDLVATVTDATTGIVTQLILGVDYTIDDAYVNTSNGGEIVLNDPLGDGDLMVLSRETAQTQLVNLEESGVFPAAVVTKVFDRLTMMIQDLSSRMDTSLGRVFVLTVAAGSETAAVSHNLNNANARVVGISTTWPTIASEVSRTVNTITFEFTSPPGAEGTMVVQVTE